MEFEDEHDEEQEEEEEEEEEDDDEEITLPPPPPSSSSLPPSYDSAPIRPRVNPERRSAVVRYRECLKNHAVSLGGHALDGCGEFMPAGDEGTLDALKCAACNCHRNFHRKEFDAGETTAATPPHPPPPSYPQFSAYYRTPAPPGYLHAPQRPLAVVPSTSHSGEMDDMSHPSSSGGGGGGGGGSKKRFRSKFSQEQKDKMLAFAEKLGWRIQKHDEAAVQQFCQELEIKRQVLKVWMHNNKHTLGKKP